MRNPEDAQTYRNVHLLLTLWVSFLLGMFYGVYTFPVFLHIPCTYSSRLLLQSEAALGRET